MFQRRERSEKQSEFWVRTERLPGATPSAFYRKVNASLEKMDFARQVWTICEPAYADPSRGGRPGIDPVVYLKMLMIGFFENLPSDRAIASRCEDSLSARGFLGYGLEEATPEHSSFTVIRDRLSLEQLEAIHRVLLGALRGHGLLRGRQLGIDSSVIEANASLRALEHRNTEENYWDYVRRLAAEAGIDPVDTKAVRRFDKKREGRRTGNTEWVNPHDPEAKVGRTKDGACDMTYKPEHTVDLESGVIIHAEVRPGDAADNDASLCERVMESVATLSAVAPDAPLEKLGAELCADEGYFAIEPIAQLHQCEVRTVISDPQSARRNVARAGEEHRSALRRASRATRSKSGKALLRKRGWASRTRIRSCARPRRTAAGDVARLRKAEQAAEDRRAGVQPPRAAAAPLRSGHAQTGPRPGQTRPAACLPALVGLDGHVVRAAIGSPNVPHRIISVPPPPNAASGVRRVFQQPVSDPPTQAEMEDFAGYVESLRVALVR
jgi:transposase